ncbi:peroxiredoxin type-2 [Malassezia brasiliensis]|uniref:Putative peroxiredoxin n=1 Tax=Malassezia brasiliensis TaxID=1821822 RepID=A0AAF0DW02_9BASI|nr:peroxiredoxin type-2 [Malassezia brasiliensis]
MVCGVALTQSAEIGSTIPNTKFAYVPYSPELEDHKVCGLPTGFQSHERWKGKKVVIVSVPGAFTPTCTANHVPPYVEKIQEFKNKGVDEVVVIAANDPFVMSAWGVSEQAKDLVTFAQDVNCEFSQAFKATLDLSSKGMGERTARYALIANDLKVEYFGIDQGEPQQSSAATLLSKL